VAFSAVVRVLGPVLPMLAAVLTAVVFIAIPTSGFLGSAIGLAGASVVAVATALVLGRRRTSTEADREVEHGLAQLEGRFQAASNPSGPPSDSPAAALTEASTLLKSFGIIALLSLSGNLEHPGKKNGVPRTPSIYRLNIRVPSFLQMAAFFAGLLFMLMFGSQVT
jgi:hypothetical protein